MRPTSNYENLVCKPLISFALYDFLKANEIFLPPTERERPVHRIYDYFTVIIKNKLALSIKKTSWKTRKNKYSFSIKINNERDYRLIYFLQRCRNIFVDLDESLFKTLFGSEKTPSDISQILFSFNPKGFLTDIFEGDPATLYLPYNYFLVNEGDAIFSRLDFIISLTTSLTDEKIALMENIIKFLTLTQYSFNSLKRSLNDKVSLEFINFTMDYAFSRTEYSIYGGINEAGVGRLISDYRKFKANKNLIDEKTIPVPILKTKSIEKDLINRMFFDEIEHTVPTISLTPRNTTVITPASITLTRSITSEAVLQTVPEIPEPVATSVETASRSTGIRLIRRT